MGKAIGKALIKLFKNASVEDLDFKKRLKPNQNSIQYQRGKAFVYRPEAQSEAQVS
jgi:hypothetical protein